MEDRIYGLSPMDYPLFNISLDAAGRRFNREWVFRGITYSLIAGSSYAILGPNGSGKSTLLQLLNGSLSPSEGKVQFQLNNESVDMDSVFTYISLAAPYLELIEEFTLTEVIDFHFKFKPFIKGMAKAGVIDLLGMKVHQHKPVKYFSSGMKQRLKLALAFCSDTPVLMLDEPTSNLDNQGTQWYLDLIQRFSAGRLTIVCSNQLPEYEFCNHQLNILDYK